MTKLTGTRTSTQYNNNVTFKTIEKSILLFKLNTVLYPNSKTRHDNMAVAIMSKYQDGVPFVPHSIIMQRYYMSLVMAMMCWKMDNHLNNKHWICK